MATSDVSELLAPEQYRAQRQSIFPSDGSFGWYLRQHRTAVIDAEAILLHAGRWYVHPARFDAYVLKAGREAAQRRKMAA